MLKATLAPAVFLLCRGTKREWKIQRNRRNALCFWEASQTGKNTYPRLVLAHLQTVTEVERSGHSEIRSARFFCCSCG